MKLNDKLSKLNTYPFHMPGHKRNEKFNITGAWSDITEMNGFDNLHCPKGILSELEKDISNLFGYKKSIISVNGSTCGILSAICAVCEKGEKIIIARNCHKSVYDACFLQELDVIYLEPEFIDELGVYGRINQKTVDNALKENSDAKAIVITSPTYEGIVSEIKCEIPLIVDAAHGAHFGFAEWLPKKADGDIIIQSLHKTLPCLTQTAVVHINNEGYFRKVKMYMDIFETSSPSYVLLSSVDICVDFLKACREAFEKYKSLIDGFYKRVKKIENISVYPNDDLTRLIISAKGYTGAELAEHLRNNKIEPEGATLNFVILISTVADTQKGFELLYNALSSIEKRSDIKRFTKKITIPQKRYKSSESEKAVATPLEKSVGKICAAYIFAYPPDVPIIIPGEIISEEIISYIRLCLENGVNMISDDNLLPDSILTKAE